MKFHAAEKGQPVTRDLFEELNKIYVKVLEFDSYDVEANFNLGLLYLQSGQEINKALSCFETCVAKDDGSP